MGMFATVGNPIPKTVREYFNFRSKRLTLCLVNRAADDIGNSWLFALTLTQIACLLSSRDSMFLCVSLLFAGNIVIVRANNLFIQAALCDKGNL